MEFIIDVSKWQGNPDFNSYRSAFGASGVIHKAGGSNGGDRYVDSQYRANAPRIRAAGLALGHYWFNGGPDPVGDADFFVNNLASYDSSDLLVLDVEAEDGVMWNPEQTLNFLRRVLARTGKRATVYMSASVTRQGGWGAVAAEGYPLWVASYGYNNGSAGSAPSIGGWSDWEGWQYTSQFHGLDASQFRHPIGTVVSGSAGGDSGGSTGGANVSNQSTSWIQQRLVDLGYSVGSSGVDGIYGADTTAAVTKFQSDHGLTVDGIAGPQTVGALGAAQAAPAPAPAPAPSGQLVVDGVWGPATTKAMQHVLGVTEDGSIGPDTIAHLQMRLGIPHDGINGPQTHKALQAHVGAVQDGDWGTETATKLQQALNAGTF